METKGRGGRRPKPPRVPAAGELGPLRRINRALVAEDERHARRVAALEAERAAAVKELRTREVAPWSFGELAGQFGVTRGAVQQWEDPGLLHRPAGAGSRRKGN
jgi:hypothetical protein